jgi:hypothetical protein
VTFRDAYAQRLAVYEEIDRTAGNRSTRDTYTRLALHYGIARARAAVTWADAAASELRGAERARA